MNRQPTMAEVRAGQPDDGLTSVSPDDVLWTRVNTAEAIPGVMRPFAWSYYAYGVEAGIRQGFHNLGMVPAGGAIFPRPAEQRILASFHGRLAANVNTARRIFAALPGVSGDDVERDLLGSVREGVRDDNDPRRLFVQMGRISHVLLLGRRQPPRNRAAIDGWWRAVVDGERLRAGLDPQQVLRDSVARFIETLRLHIWMRMFVQAVSAQLTVVVEQAGDPNALGTLLAGAAGTEEAALADDLFRVATGKLSLDRFIADHGYQGPNSGDPAARVWREDRRGLERLLGAVADSEPPADRRARAVAERDRAVAKIVAALPAHRRPAARLAIRLAPAASRSIQGTKTSMLLAVDGGRAAARALGANWLAAGTLSDPEDVFQLFTDELVGGRGRDLRDLVAQRHELRAQLLRLEVPETWQGQPVVGVQQQADPQDAVTAMTLSGLGASAGVAEGRVRIVLDAADDIDIDAGDILVCPTTDPSWVSLMTVAAALVIDIGAAVSHGAIVARELGVPCVIGTRTGTRDLRDGDLVRVDGSTGVVEVLERGRQPMPTESVNG